jgi:hypothetical protein
MAKPSITKRSTKGAALTYAELDTNFQNLDDATITVTGDSGTITNNLNDSFQIAGGTGLTSSVAGSVLTVNLDNTAVTAGSYTTANITVDAQGRITAAANGSGGGGGTVNTGSGTRLAYYPSTGTTVDDIGITYTTSGSAPATNTLAAESTATLKLASGGLGYISITYGGGVEINAYNGLSQSGKFAIGTGYGGATASTIDSPSITTTASTKFKLDTPFFEITGSSITLGASGGTIAYDSGATKITFDKAIQTSNLKITTNEIQAMNLNGNIKLTPDGTGKIQLGSLYFPTSDGTANQVLKTDGSGNLSWVTAGGGGFSTVLLTFGTAVDVGGGIEKCTVTETIDTGSICTVSGYDFTLPAGTYLVSLSTRWHGLSSGFAGGDYSWTSVSGDATISSVATISKPTTTTGIVYQNIATITLTQTSTFYQQAPSNNAFYNSSAIPKFWTFVKTA